MSEPVARGPIWVWTTAWSLQGAAAFAVLQLYPEPGWAQFTLMGAAAGLPLAGLYLWLGREPEDR